MSAALVYFLLIGDLVVMGLMIALLLWLLLCRGSEDASRAAQIPLHDELPEQESPEQMPGDMGREAAAQDEVPVR